MKRKLAVFVVAAALLAASAALAASSPPVAGGLYKGKVVERAYPFKTNRSVTLRVTKSGANFTHSRISLVLNGQGGLGSCAGQAYITINPTHARQITKRGTFDLHGHFTFKVKTPYGPSKYKTSVTIKGAFGAHGKQVTGTVRETAIGKGLTCRSGTLRFSAALA